jgi:hypothetical protein
MNLTFWRNTINITINFRTTVGYHCYTAVIHFVWVSTFRKNLVEFYESTLVLLWDAIQHHTMLWDVTLHHTLPWGVILHHTLLWDVTLHHTLPWGVILHHTLLWDVICIIHCCEMLFCIIYCCEMLFCIIHCCEMLPCIIHCCEMLFCIIHCCEMLSASYTAVRCYLHHTLLWDVTLHHTLP